MSPNPVVLCNLWIVLRDFRAFRDTGSIRTAMDNLIQIMEVERPACGKLSYVSQESIRRPSLASDRRLEANEMQSSNLFYHD